jgi:membrane protein required for colicin V production
MAAFDWVIVAILLISVITAIAEGFAAELFSFAGVILGFLLASWHYWRLAPWFEEYVKSTAAANFAGFITILLCVAVISGAIGKVARWAMKEAGLRWIDRVLGGAFGLLRGLLVVTAVVLAVATFMPQAKWLEKSQLSGYFLLSARVASWLAPSDVRHKLHEGLAVIRNTRMQDAAPQPQSKEAGAAGSGRP